MGGIEFDQLTYMAKFQKQGVKPPPPLWSQGWPADKKKLGRFYVQKRPSKFFETKNIFIFGAGPNFGRSQKRGFTLYLEVLPGPQLGPQNTELEVKHGL